MFPKGKVFPLAAVTALLWIAGPASSYGGEWLDALRSSSKEQVETVETEALFKEADLSKKYVTALGALEKKLAADGNLDVIVHLREEREAIEKSGQPTSHADKPIVELREKYNSGVKAIREELAVARKKINMGVSQKIKEQETLLTKAGKVDEALATRKDGESLLLELSAGTDTGEVVVADDPRAMQTPDLKPLKQITIPADKPKTLDKPFAIKGRWLESITVPVLKQRISENVIIGDRGKKAWVTVVVPPGSVWTTGESRYIELSAGSVVANKTRFENLSLLPDLASTFYFLNCDFSNCGFNKGGEWYGWDLAGKFYFENCVVRKRFNQHMNITDTGVRAQNSVFEKIEFASFSFNKKEPAAYVNEPWLRYANCRFIECEIPISVLLLTRDCIFDDCIFVDDRGEVNKTGFTRPIEVTIYENNCKSRISQLPANVKLIEKRDTEWKGPTIPTTDSLTGMMGL